MYSMDYTGWVWFCRAGLDVRHPVPGRQTGGPAGGLGLAFVELESWGGRSEDGVRAVG